MERRGRVLTYAFVTDNDNIGAHAHAHGRALHIMSNKMGLILEVELPNVRGNLQVHLVEDGEPREVYVLDKRKGTVRLEE